MTTENNIPHTEKLYSIFDEKARDFSPPFPSKNVHTATRMFAETVNGGDRKQNKLALYPSDFSLYQLGFFNQETGEIISQKQHLLRADEVLRSQEVPNGN